MVCANALPLIADEEQTMDDVRTRLKRAATAFALPLRQRKSNFVKLLRTFLRSSEYPRARKKPGNGLLPAVENPCCGPYASAFHEDCLGPVQSRRLAISKEIRHACSNSPGRHRQAAPRSPSSPNFALRVSAAGLDRAARLRPPQPGSARAPRPCRSDPCSRGICR